MARFSIGRDDDADENATTPKRLRMTTDASVATTSNQHPENDDELVEGEDTDDVESGDEEEESEEDELEHSDEHTQSEEEAVAVVDAGGSSRNATESGGGDVRDLVRSPGIGSVQMILTDPDVLDCSVCLEALTIPVFQCENGHIACASCCTKMSNKCPSCSMPIGYNRCRAIEKVIESVKISCRYVEYGCNASLLYSKKSLHESSCAYAPCSCPLDNCNFVGTSKNLYAHIAGKHLNSTRAFNLDSKLDINLEESQKCLILLEQTKGTIFVLNHHHERLGSAVNVIHIESASSKKYSYEIIYGGFGEELKLKSYAECISKWSADNPLKKYLLVPIDFIGSCSQIRLSLRIYKHWLYYR